MSSNSTPYAFYHLSENVGRSENQSNVSSPFFRRKYQKQQCQEIRNISQDKGNQDIHYSTEFKRKFVKGMICIALTKHIDEMSLFLRQLAPTIVVKPSSLSVWVTTYLIVFKIEAKIKKQRMSSTQILKLIEDEVIELMRRNKGEKKERIIEYVANIFRELHVKLKAVDWLESTIRRNVHRLEGVEVAKFYTASSSLANEKNQRAIVKNEPPVQQ